ncbi:hypothetical protein [Vibrio nigripulchritudo]|uniref:hypothetical protein n=1 Tax=Vibrio nigripulchritudo TaxID=28173 RepID=UPI0005F9CFA5|nr:hypothetical protein [Vibrio nigripulchritudo]KJY76943.1 hypothetical protein TW74_14185 [Vibrio nigripulchritudo]
MNREEKIALDFLNSCELDMVEFEPNGNVPPDFHVSNFKTKLNVAVEVTRLCQVTIIDGVPKKLDSEFIPLFQSINSTLEKFEGGRGNSYFLKFSVKQPFGSLKALRNNLVKLLRSFDDMSDSEKSEVHSLNASGSISVSFSPRGDSVEQPRFRLAGILPMDASGFLYPELLQAVQHAIEEKTEKMSKYVHQFDESWLILVDSFSYGRGGEYVLDLRKELELGCFSKIIILNPLSGELSMEI